MQPVTSTLLQTGAGQYVNDGDCRFVYWAAFRVRTGETYCLAVTRSDGEAASATATIPGPIGLEVLEAEEIIIACGNPPVMPRTGGYDKLG